MRRAARSLGLVYRSSAAFSWWGGWEGRSRDLSWGCPEWSRAFAAERPAAGEIGLGAHRIDSFAQDRIRNFSIIAHIDHGKSTLADRILERTGAIDAGSKAQFLDSLAVEGERGITVKAKTVSVVYEHRGVPYLLNLIDTPGHVDFAYEVSRSLAACTGALLLVDASQGIQAQTVANFFLAFELDLSIVPVINKIDMPTADVPSVQEQLRDVLALQPADCVLASAKTGQGLDDVLAAVVERMPCPAGNAAGPLRMMLFDAHHDPYRGVICLFQVVDGSLRRGDRIVSSATKEAYDAQEIGVLTPKMVPCDVLSTGQVGYVITGMKAARSARVGDTWHVHNQPVEALRGFQPALPKVFAGIYPMSAEQFNSLQEAIDRLLLTDSSVVIQREHSAALGMGFRCGFLGLLHMDVFRQRLEQEYGAIAVITSPTVPYRVVLADGSEVTVENPVHFPVGQKIKEVHEPVVRATVIVPNEHLGVVLQLCHSRRGEPVGQSSLGPSRTLLHYLLPASELASSFYDDLKSATSGYASFDYEDAGDRVADMVRLDLLVNGEPVDAMAKVVHRDEASRVGRRLVTRLQAIMQRELFDVVLQAKTGGKIVVRETVKAYRKDVTAKCYGGDVSRKRKLLEKQKEGKKRMRAFGNVQVPLDAFVDMAKA